MPALHGATLALAEGAIPIGPTPTPTARVSSTPGPSCTPAIVALLVPVMPMSALPPPGRQICTVSTLVSPGSSAPVRVALHAESRYSAGARSGARTWILRRTSSERAGPPSERSDDRRSAGCRPAVRLQAAAHPERAVRPLDSPTHEAQVRRPVATCEEKPRIARRGDDVWRGALRLGRPVRSPSRARASCCGKGVYRKFSSSAT